MQDAATIETRISNLEDVVKKLDELVRKHIMTHGFKEPTVREDAYLRMDGARYFNGVLTIETRLCLRGHDDQLYDQDETLRYSYIAINAGFNVDRAESGSLVLTTKTGYKHIGSVLESLHNRLGVRMDP